MSMGISRLKHINDFLMTKFRKKSDIEGNVSGKRNV